MRWDNLRLDDLPLDDQRPAGPDAEPGSLPPAGHRDTALPLIERGAVARAFDGSQAIDTAASLSNRIDLLVSDRSELFEQWLPVWHFAERVRSVAPAVGLGVAQLRKVLRERLAAWFSTELGNLDPGSRNLVLDSLDLAFGLDSWMNMREQLRLSPIHASRTWRFTAEAIVLQALTVPAQPVAVA